MIFLEDRKRSILEMASIDPEEIPAPKDLWPLSKDEALRAYWKERREMARGEK